MDEVALPGLAVGDDGDLEVGRRGRLGTLAALFGSEIDADADRAAPGAIDGAEGGGVPAGGESGGKFTVHMPAVAAGVLEEDGVGAVGPDAGEDVGRGEIGARAFEP